MKPNILFIQTDEQRVDSIGAYSGWAKTPALDQLAEEGVIFLNHHCQAPVCMPSRSSLFACMPPLEIGCLNNNVPSTEGYPEGIVSFPEIFAQNGYTTASFGLRHTVNRPSMWQHEKPIDAFPCMSHFELHPPFDEKEHRLLFRKTDFPLISAGIYPDGQTDCAKLCVENGMEFLDHQENDQSWLMRLSIMWPHTPVLCPRPFDELYEEGFFQVKRHSQEGRASRSQYDKGIAKSHNFDAFTDAELEWVYRSYYGLCAYVDSQIGRMTDYLKEKGLYDNTIILFASDHGRMLGEWGAGEKGNFDRPVWNTSLIMKYAPVIPAGRERTDITENIDIGTTLLSLCGLKDKIPDYYRGEVLFPGETKRKVTYGAIKGAFDPLKPDTFRYAMFYGRWRMDVDFDIYGRAMDYDKYDGSLYDLDNDPSEEFNLFNKPEYRKTTEDLLKKMFDDFSSVRVDDRLLHPEYFRFTRSWKELSNGMKIPKRK